MKEVSNARIVVRVILHLALFAEVVALSVIGILNFDRMMRLEPLVSLLPLTLLMVANVKLMQWIDRT